MKNIFKNYDRLNSTDKSIIQYMIKNVDEIKDITANTLAKKLFISKTTIINLAKKLDFDGYAELKYYLTHHLIKKEKINSNSEDIYINIENEVNKTLKMQDKTIVNDIVNDILNKKVIYIFSRGASANQGEYLASRLSILKIKAIFISDINLLEVLLEHIKDDEMVIFLSQSGSTKILVESSMKLELKNIYTLSITSFSDNLLAKHSKKNLFFYADKLNTSINDTYSRVGMNVVVQILIDSIKSEIHKKGKNG